VCATKGRFFLLSNHTHRVCFFLLLQKRHNARTDGQTLLLAIFFFPLYLYVRSPAPSGGDEEEEEEDEVQSS